MWHVGQFRNRRKVGSPPQILTCSPCDPHKAVTELIVHSRTRRFSEDSKPVYVHMAMCFMCIYDRVYTTRIYSANLLLCDAQCCAADGLGTLRNILSAHHLECRLKSVFILRLTSLLYDPCVVRRRTCEISHHYPLCFPPPKM